MNQKENGLKKPPIATKKLFHFRNPCISLACCHILFTESIQAP